MIKKLILFSFLLFISVYRIQAQQTNTTPNDKNFSIQNGDTLLLIDLPAVYVYPPYEFKSEKEERYYWRMVRDVKKTLPLAKLVYATLIETYEYIETLPTEKERKKHLERMEKELFEEYKPMLKKFTYTQGKMLIRLIDRECNQSSFNLIKAFLGNFKAGMWQAFGVLFGVSLKAEWDPNGKDAMLERICVLVENGLL